MRRTRLGTTLFLVLAGLASGCDDDPSASLSGLIADGSLPRDQFVPRPPRPDQGTGDDVDQGQPADQGLTVDLGAEPDAGTRADSACVDIEICNDKDDNCDGITDEGFDLGEACFAGQGACRVEGQTVCSGDGASTDCDAVAGQPEVEICNDDIDNDCDGQVDECDGGQICVGGACVPDVPPACRADDQCAPGEICVEGDCVPEAGCAGDVDCIEGERCVDAACVPDDIGPACSPDDLEANDALDTATPLAVGQIGGLNICGDDADNFAIELCAGGRMVLDLRFSHADGDLDLDLLDADGNSIGDSASATDDERIEWQSEAGGTFYAVVFGFDGDENTYEIALEMDCGPAPICDAETPCPEGQICTDGECVRDIGPACEDDVFEDNDTFATATAVEPGQYPDLRLCGVEDVGDVFAVQICAGGTLTVDVLFTHADGDLDAALFDLEGTALAVGDSVDDNEQLIYDADADAVLFVSIAGFNNAENGYALNVDVAGCDEAPICIDDELEPNDSVDEAAFVQTPAILEGTLCAADPDVYSVRVCAGGTLSARATFSHAVGDLDLVIFNGAGDLIALGDSVDDDETADAADLDAAIYYVAVAGAAEEISNTYTLEIDVLCDCIEDADCGDAEICTDGICENQGAACIDDAFEDNDDLQSATAFDGGLLDGLMICQDDADVLAIDVCAGGTLTVTTTFVHADGDLDLELLDAGGELASSTLTSDSETVSWTAGELAATVYARVFGFAGAENTYAIEVLIEGCDAGPVCVDDGFEENDDIATAAPVAGLEDAQLTLCADDLDTFAVELCAGSTLTVAARFSTADGDLDLSIRDLAGNELAGSASVTDDEGARYLSDADQTVIVEISGYQGAENDYALDIVATGCGCAGDRECPAGQACMEGVCVSVAACEDDAFEDNDVLETATAVDAGELLGLAICEGDDDFYSVGVCAGGTVTVDTAFLHADGDLELQLLAADGTVLAGSTSGTDDERVIYVADVDERLTARVYGFNGAAANTYDLAIAVEGCGAVPVCVEDAWEENDAMDAASPLALGLNDSYAICADDADWHVIEACEGTTTVTVQFTHADGDLDATLYDAAGTVLDVGRSTNDDEALRADVAAGPLFLEVRGFAGDENTYAVVVDLVCTAECAIDADCPAGLGCFAGACEPLPVCVDDALEANDAIADASPLVEPVLGAQICSGNDDYFIVGVCAGGTPLIDLSFIDADGDLDLEALNVDGSRIALANSSTDDEQLELAPVDVDSLLVLRVSGFLGDENTYDLAVDVIGCAQPPVCIEDDLEENDTADTAVLVEPGEYVGLGLCDAADWFDIEVCAGGTLTATARFIDADGDLDLALSPPGVAPLVSAGVGDTEALRWTAVEAAFVGVTVIGYQDATNQYDLSLVVEGCPPPPPPCVIDADCLADEICLDGLCELPPPPVCPDATLIEGLGTHQGSTVGLQNLDAGSCGGGAAPEMVFNWLADVDGPICFETLPGVLDTVIYARVADCTPADEIACNDDGLAVGPSSMDFDAVAGTEYFIFVDGFDSEGDFELDVRPGPCQQPPEICDDGIDNNNDGLIDCDDAECVGALICETVLACREMTPIEAFGPILGTTVGALNEVNSLCGGNGGEAVFVAQFALDGVICLDTFGSAYDTVLHVRTDGCSDGVEVDCNDDAAGLTQSQIELAVTADQPYFVFVDGFGGEGEFTLNVANGPCPPPVEICDDGLENDGDGQIDCADTDCAFAPNCVQFLAATCEQPRPIFGDGAIAGTTVGKIAAHTGSCGGAGNEAVHLIQSEVDTVVCLDTFGSAEDTVLYVREAICADPAAELSCNDDLDLDTFQSEIELQLTANTPYFIFVDHFGGEGGDFVLNTANGPCL